MRTAQIVVPDIGIEALAHDRRIGAERYVVVELLDRLVDRCREDEHAVGILRVLQSDGIARSGLDVGYRSGLGDAALDGVHALEAPRQRSDILRHQKISLAALGKGHPRRRHDLVLGGIEALGRDDLGRIALLQRLAHRIRIGYGHHRRAQFAVDRHVADKAGLHLEGLLAAVELCRTRGGYRIVAHIDRHAVVVGHKSQILRHVAERSITSDELPLAGILRPCRRYLIYLDDDLIVGRRRRSQRQADLQCTLIGFELEARVGILRACRRQHRQQHQCQYLFHDSVLQRYFTSKIILPTTD